MRWTRRRVLQAAVAAGGAVSFPWANAIAQSGGSTGLIRAAKQALLMGNGRYQHAPLKNPVNDASGMAEVLKAVGFDVTLALELTQSAMRDAIQAYTDSLARTKSVGLFYFAGHGAQLAWRNYLIPVDAEIGDIQELRERGVDVNSLIEGIRRAGNPMNMIILDACRDNPFGSFRRLDQKGLSQLDAPPGTLLAYATAPGNTAIDGEGTHGLYTEHLLKEIKVPEAKVEDVFKRVRLAVRRRSNGQQIPWESTSLEEDFYFVPPRLLSTLADEEAERERRQELALREKRRAEEEAERKRKQEQALREARLAAEQAERRQQQELALLEQQHIAEEAERKRMRELALKEAQRAADEAERKRKEEQALREARLAEEEAARKYKQELALQEKRRAEEEAERKRKEEQALREARIAEEEAARKYQQEIALHDKQRAQDEAERRRKQEPAPSRMADADLANHKFEEELEVWERIKASKEPGPLEEYLLRYPSGRFSELAQLNLDRILARLGEKRIEIAPSAGNPFTKGSVTANTNYKVGDSYTYRVTDLLTRLERKQPIETITAITDTEVIYNDGKMSTDFLGNYIRDDRGRLLTASQYFVTEYSIGKKWTTRFVLTRQNGTKDDVELDFKVIGKEAIAVPAGTFEAWKIEGQGYVRGAGAYWNYVYWIAPDKVRRFVAMEYVNRGRGRKLQANDRYELVLFKQS